MQRQRNPVSAPTLQQNRPLATDVALQPNVRFREQSASVILSGSTAASGDAKNAASAKAAG
jgi:hypothetical protein